MPISRKFVFVFSRKLQKKMLKFRFPENSILTRISPKCWQQFLGESYFSRLWKIKFEVKTFFALWKWHLSKSKPNQYSSWRTLRQSSFFYSIQDKNPKMFILFTLKTQSIRNRMASAMHALPLLCIFKAQLKYL